MVPFGRDPGNLMLRLVMRGRGQVLASQLPVPTGNDEPCVPFGRDPGNLMLRLVMRGRGQVLASQLPVPTGNDEPCDKIYKNVNDQEVYSEVTKDSSNNLFLVLTKDDDISSESDNVLGEGNDALSKGDNASSENDDTSNISYSSYHFKSSESDDISEITSFTSLKAIFKNIKSEYTLYYLSDKDIIRCHKIFKKEVNENDNNLVLKVFESI
ncbi:hypothetical protein Glove_88g51 [Diversispora epigaea]|uniref:Uncharacterized protein n=1 Tax=Diversispora epigaea TaxID=1348612 RepID=A0A397J5U2_9GLOM|nr:hypothetical protein Glove_88g51 [Diversispora epigaea]